MILLFGSHFSVAAKELVQFVWSYEIRTIQPVWAVSFALVASLVVNLYLIISSDAQVLSFVLLASLLINYHLCVSK